MKSVSKSEFQDFISNYPGKLEVDICGLCDPPMVSYNDFSIGEWPESIVAKTWKYDEEPGECFYKPEENREYYILDVTP